MDVVGRRGSDSTRYSGGLAVGQQEIKCSRRVWQPVLANTLQYSCLENPLDREAWQATAYRVAESDTTEVTLYAWTQDVFCLWQLCPSES